MDHFCRQLCHTAGLSAPALGDNNASNTVAAVIAPAASTATLNGTVTSTGGENPTVYFVWGDDDAGTDYAIFCWDNQVPMGVIGSIHSPQILPV